MKSKRFNWREELLDTALHEGAMDKIGGMSDSQFKDFINANPGAAAKAKKIRDKAKSAILLRMFLVPSRSLHFCI